MKSANEKDLKNKMASLLLIPNMFILRHALFVTLIKIMGFLTFHLYLDIDVNNTTFLHS